MVRQDLSRIQEPGKSTSGELAYQANLQAYFNDSVGTDIEKLQNFTKYVPRQSISYFLAKYELFKRVLNIQGSIIECGVYLGGGLMTFAQLSAIFEPVNHQRKIVGFDTFAGFATLTEQDQKGTSAHSTPGGLFVEPGVAEDLDRCIELYDSNRFVGHIPKASVVKGDIKETIPQYIEDNPHTVVSLLYLDVDVFEPTKVAIEYLVPRMPKGGIIAFDELNSERWPGETLAALDTIGLGNLRIERFSFDPFLSFAAIE